MNQTPSQVYYVRSSRDPDRFYTVAENPRGFLECDCPAASFYRSKPCKHAEQVRRGAGLRALPKARPAVRHGRQPSAEIAALGASLEV